MSPKAIPDEATLPDFQCFFPRADRQHVPPRFFKGEAFLLTAGAFLLTVKLLCLQSLKVLIRRTLPL